MVGYNRSRLVDLGIRLERFCDTMSVSNSKRTSSFYKIIMDFDESRGIDDSAFSVLVVLLLLSARNTFKLSDKSCKYIIENHVVHELNRALYHQVDISNRMKKESDTLPEWKIMAIEEIGKGNFYNVIALMMVKYKIDFEKMIVASDRLEYFIGRTSIFSKKTFITFGDIENACSNYTDK